MDRLISARSACIVLATVLLWGCAVARQAKPETEPVGVILPSVPESAQVQIPADPPPAELTPSTASVSRVLTGKASFYANSLHGRKTASGRTYRKEAYTAAHRRLPLGTWVKVTNTRNSHSVLVEINDRGPYVRGRIIDLSRAAARKLAMLKSGIAPVQVEVVERSARPAVRVVLASNER